MGEIELIAAEIRAARSAGRCLDAAAVPVAEHQAYPVQRLLIQHRLDAGERVAGFKLGYTSEAMRRQMGIAQPNHGPLTDAMLLPDGAALPSAIAPKVEPEIALVLATDVEEPLSPDGCRTVVAGALLALEVVDSVWCGYEFTWAHNTADGSSAAYVVLGPDLDRGALADTRVTLERNGIAVGQGTGSAAMGDPYRALAWLTGELVGSGRRLQRGDVVITGGLCPAIDLLPGDTVTARTDGCQVAVHRA